MYLTIPRREVLVPLAAMDVAVSRHGWISIPAESASADRAQEIMKERRFDVLPVGHDDPPLDYFMTLKWNDYSSVVRRRIQRADVIVAETPFREVLRGMAGDDRLFYFVGDRTEVFGLLSVANLNRRQVKVYLFSLVCELEMQLGKLVSRHVPEEEVRACIARRVSEEGNDTGRIVSLGASRGVDEDPVEQLYLSDMVNLARQRGLHDLLGYSRREFRSAMNPIVELRNRVAHMVRPLITSPDGAARLWKDMMSIEEVVFRLRRQER